MLQSKSTITSPRSAGTQCFKSATTVLTLKYMTVSSTGTTYYNASSVNFTSPEATPEQAPQVTAAKETDDQVIVNWILPGHCPGFIIQYRAKIFCDDNYGSGEQPGNSGNISLDCRNHNASQLIANVPD